jgi:hypothetical protein
VGLKQKSGTKGKDKKGRECGGGGGGGVEKERLERQGYPRCCWEITRRQSLNGRSDS